MAKFKLEFFNEQNHTKQAKPKVTKEKEAKYAHPPHVKNDTGKKLKDVRKKLAKNADKPTTASGEKGQKDLPSLVQQVDPQGQAQVLPQLYQNIGMINSLLSLGSGMKGGGGGGTDPMTGLILPSISTGVIDVITDSFTGALAILVGRYGYERVIKVFADLIAANGTAAINGSYRNIVLNSLSNLIRIALYYGPSSIPISSYGVYDQTFYGDFAPNIIISEASVPDLYKKVYYASIEEDPYPGFVQWISPDGTTSVYTRRKNGDYYYTSAAEETFSTSELSLANSLDPYVKLNLPAVLTMAIFNDILDGEGAAVEANIMNLNLGNNTGGGSGSQMMGMMMGMLGGLLQQLIMMFTSEQLPTSVLNQGNMNQLTQQFTKDMGLNNQIFELAQGALGGGMGGMSALGGLGGMSNILGGFGMGGGGIEGVLGGLGGGSLLSGFGGMGGGSGGGGGGAGSGFPTASVGEYSGGGVSDQGIKDMKTLMTYLGIS